MTAVSLASSSERRKIGLRTHHALTGWTQVLPPERPDTRRGLITSPRGLFDNACSRLDMLPCQDRCSSSLQAVVFSYILKRFLQVLNEAHRRKLFSTARAPLHRRSFAGTPIQLDAHGCWAFNKMEKFSKW